MAIPIMISMKTDFELALLNILVKSEVAIKSPGSVCGL